MIKAGEADEDDDWTFGQVLSLTTWIPIGIELITVYICKYFALVVRLSAWNSALPGCVRNKSNRADCCMCHLDGAQESVQRGLSKRFKVIDKRRQSQFFNGQVVYEKTSDTDMIPLEEAHVYKRAPSADVTPIDESHVQASDSHRYDS